MYSSLSTAKSPFTSSPLRFEPNLLFQPYFLLIYYTQFMHWLLLSCVMFPVLSFWFLFLFIGNIPPQLPSTYHRFTVPLNLSSNVLSFVYFSLTFFCVSLMMVTTQCPVHSNLHISFSFPLFTFASDRVASHKVCTGGCETRLEGRRQGRGQTC